MYFFLWKGGHIGDLSGKSGLEVALGMSRKCDY